MGEGGGNYRQAGLPAALAKAIVGLIHDHPELGYRSLSEFARHSCIEHLRHVEAHLALKTLHHTAELGAEAVEALLRDSLPRDYRAILESERRRA